MQEHENQWISSYIDCELTETERIKAEAHLQSCHSCQSMVEELREVKQEMKVTYEKVEPPLFLEETVLAIIQNGIKAKEMSIFLKGWPPLAVFISLSMLTILLISPIGNFVGLLFSSSFRLLLSLMRMVPKFFNEVPSILIGVIIFATMVVFISFWSLKRILVIKESV